MVQSILRSAVHNIKGEEEEIPPLLQKLNISDSSFMVSEFARSKNTLREGKSAGKGCKELQSQQHHLKVLQPCPARQQTA